MTSGLMLLALTVSAPALKDRRGDAPPIVGEWIRVGHTQAGAPVAPDRQPHRQVFKSDGVWEYYYGDRPSNTARMEFVTDPRQKPASIDIYMNPTTREGYRGVYKVEGDTLTLCLLRGDGDRPKTFESSPDRPTTIWVFKRVMSKE